MRPTTKTTNLTPARTDLIGRNLELARLRELFESGRLVTVVGIGGTGKTRLAREFGRISVGNFPGGVWMLELANFDSVDEAMRELAQMLGVGFGGQASSVQPIVEALKNKPRTLVIFDNVEHIVDQIADPIARIVDRTREVSVLATSREPIRIQGEQRFKLSPLGHEAAVNLFVQRASELMGTFELGDHNREAIENLVDQLDRLPLAIELAAARVKVLPPDQLVGRLSQRLHSLRSRDRERPSRHETLAATIDWSWDLLDEQQQRGLERCSVFRGGFSIEAIEAVVQYDGLAEDLVEDLIERSLLEYEDTVAGRRFFLFELVRRLAEEKLANSGDQAELHARHAEFYTELVEATPPESIYKRQADLPNLLAALRRVDGEQQARVAIAAATVLRLTGSVSLLEERLSDLLMESKDPSLQAKLFLLRGIAAHERREYEDARRDVERAAQIADDEDDAEVRADALTISGLTLLELGRVEEGMATLQSALDCAQKSGNSRLETIALGTLGLAHSQQGDWGLAETLFERAIARCRAAGDDVLTGRSLLNLGGCQSLHGRWNEARANLEDALSYLDKVEDDRKRGVANLLLGGVHRALQQPAEAKKHYELARDIGHALGWKETETAALIGLGELSQDAADRTYLVQAIQLNEGAPRFADEAKPRSHLALHDLLGQRHEFARPQFRRALGVVGEADPRWSTLLLGYLALSYAMVQDQHGSKDALGLMEKVTGRDELDAELTDLFARTCGLFSDGQFADRADVAATIEVLEEMEHRPLAFRSASWSSHDPLKTLRELIENTFGAGASAVLAVSRDGRRFVPPDAEEVDFSRRGPLRKIIVALAEAREQRPGQGLSADDVLEAGWPGDIVTADAGAARVYSAVRTLRTHGWEDLLLTQDDGYLIDPEIAIVWLD